jgi:orotate phosphoribosyltransferase
MRGNEGGWDTGLRMSEDYGNQSSQTELLNLLHSRQGHFKFESGHHGNLWLDLELLFLRPKAIRPFVDELTRKLSPFRVDAICGPMVGGALIAQTMAVELEVDFYYTERVLPQHSDALYSADYHLPHYLRETVNGKRVAVVDDVINAGSAVRGTLAELQSLGARSVVIGSLLVLGDVGQNYFAERSIPVRSISHLPSEIWRPEDCPLCASKIPFDKPD